MSQPTSSQFSLEVDVQPDAIVLHCAGRLTLESGNILRTEVRKLMKPGDRIVLDLTHVTQCDSSGLGAVIGLYVTSKSTPCRLELVNLGPKIRIQYDQSAVIV